MLDSGQETARVRGAAGQGVGEGTALTLPAPLSKAILSVLSERDQNGRHLPRRADGNPEPDAELRDYENVPLKEEIHAYFDREVKPHVPDAWIDESKTQDRL